MTRNRELYPNLSVMITRVCSSSSDSSGSAVMREVWNTDSAFTDHNGRWLGVRQSWGSVKASLHNDPVHLQHRGKAPGPPWPGPRNRFQNGCVDLSVIGGQYGVSKQRFDPYGRPNSKGERNARRFGAEDKGREEKTWFKITIPHGKKYDKRWLLTSLQNLCPIAFTPLHYSTEGQTVHFYLEDAATASALCKLTRRVTDSEGQRVVVLMSHCSSLPFLQSELKPQDLEHLKHCMSKRFDGSQKSLNLSSIRSDPDLVSQNIEIILNRKNCMQAVIKIIQENIPEMLCLNLSNNKLFKLDDIAELVNKTPNLQSLNLSHNELKSEQELDVVKGFRLVELWLDRNPLCDHFKDQASYISAVRERFPRLHRLDGHVLPLPICFDVETRTNIPPCKGSCFFSNDIQNLIQRFLQHYYCVYDSGDRQRLLEAYHDSACFSLSLPPINNTSRCRLKDYQRHSRNIKNIKDPSGRFRLLKHTRLTLVAFLNELPKTQHDINLINVDVNTYTSTLLVFTVSGVFKEVEDKSRDSVMAFSRVFVTVPARNSGLCIVNDQLFVRNATTEEIRCAFAAPAPTLSSSPVPTISASQQEMLSAFSQMSEMNLEWSQKCLQDNVWDFHRAAQIFTELKAQGKIPEAAFIK
ncbi:nuclear RNA export factor 1 [Pimephales promelas]|uniref:nuclear RNA export factor 1 n=1 Tax=Pimephales promelas TaxID=90988 RepID=UPI00195569BB|nr:nuclear RNA export factor 1 [Pimephales promelas]KAG1962294.1 nuclear RNA export factor [Pimephales promelas]